MSRDQKKKDKKEIFAWTLYDFANTSFSVIVVTVVYAVYFKQYIVSGQTISFFGIERNPGDLYWGLGGAISMFIVAVSSPLLGAIADFNSRKKYFLFVYSMFCIASTIMLTFLEPGMVWQGLFLFVVGNIGFEGAIVFYNGFLPQISKPDNIGKISGYGFAFGYIGSLLSLLIALPYANMAFVADDLSLMRPTFLWAGLFFLVFSTPFYFMVTEKKYNISVQVNSYVKEGYKRFRKTLKMIREFPEIVKFLIAYFIYIDGVNTVIYFGGIFAKDTLGFSMVEIITFFAIIQFSAISGAYVFGFLTDKLGPKKTINLTLFMWMGVSVGAFFSYDQLSFYAVGLIAGIAMGSSQSASRALMGILIPEGMEAEFYGFYALTGKFSSILGPLLFGIISTTTGSQRIAVLSVLLFFVAGFALFQRVDEKVTYKKVVI
ncbi:MAG: MFS transporter [Calditrichaceae bacterium]